MTHDNTMTKTAASADHPLLDQARRKFGFVPNLLTTMAAAPKLLESYMSVGALFDQTSLNPTERQAFCWRPVSKTPVRTAWRHTRPSRRCKGSTTG